MIAKSCLHAIVGYIFSYINSSDHLITQLKGHIRVLEVSDILLCFVCLKGFGTAISSAAPSLGGTLSTGFGATQGLGSSTFGQQTTTGTIFTKIENSKINVLIYYTCPVIGQVYQYFKCCFKEEKLSCESLSGCYIIINNIININFLLFQVIF